MESLAEASSALAAMALTTAARLSPVTPERPRLCSCCSDGAVPPAAASITVLTAVARA